MTVSSIVLGPAAASAPSSRDTRSSAVSSGDIVDFAKLLPVESVIGGQDADHGSRFDFESASPVQNMLPDHAPVPNAEQQFQLPMNSLHVPSLLPSDWVVEAQGNVSGTRVPATVNASHSAMSVSGGWSAKTTGDLPTSFDLSGSQTTLSALVGDDMQVLSVASVAFQLPAGLGMRGEGGVSLKAQPKKTDAAQVAAMSEATQFFAEDEKAALASERQSQPNAHTLRGIADLQIDLPLADIDVSPTVGESPRAAGVAQQIASAFRTLLNDSATVRDISKDMQANSWVTHQSPLRVLDLVLQPQDLGRVSIKLRLSASGLTVTLEAENNTTLKLLQQEAGALSDELISNGYDVESLSVQQLASAAVVPIREAAASVSAEYGGGSESAGFTSEGDRGSTSQGSDHQSRSRGSTKQDVFGAATDSTEGSADDRKHLYV